MISLRFKNKFRLLEKKLFIVEFHSKFVHNFIIITDILISVNLNKSSNALSVH